MQIVSDKACNFASDLQRRLEGANLLDHYDRPNDAKVYKDMAIESLIQLGNELGFDVIGKGKPE